MHTSLARRRGPATLYQWSMIGAALFYFGTPFSASLAVAGSRWGTWAAMLSLVRLGQAAGGAHRK